MINNFLEFKDICELAGWEIVVSYDNETLGCIARIPGPDPGTTAGWVAFWQREKHTIDTGFDGKERHHYQYEYSRTDHGTAELLFSQDLDELMTGMEGGKTVSEGYKD